MGMHRVDSGKDRPVAREAVKWPVCEKRILDRMNRMYRIAGTE